MSPATVGMVEPAQGEARRAAARRQRPGRVYAGPLAGAFALPAP